MGLGRRFWAEFFGTFALVFIGTGTAVLSGGLPVVGVGILGIALAFGLTLTAMAYAIGGISGCHINPAVTLGLATAKKFPWKEVGPYIVAQIFGAVVASGLLYLIASGSPIYDPAGGLAPNGYGVHSPAGFSLFSALIAETVLTFLFVMVIMGATDYKHLTAVAPIAIGAALLLANLVAIPITNASINPARSIGPAVFLGGWAMRQLWMFLIFPTLGGIIAGVVYPLLRGRVELEATHTEEVEGSQRGDMAA